MNPSPSSHHNHPVHTQHHPRLGQYNQPPMGMGMGGNRGQSFPMPAYAPSAPASASASHNRMFGMNHNHMQMNHSMIPPQAPSGMYADIPNAHVNPSNHSLYSSSLAEYPNTMHYFPPQTATDLSEDSHSLGSGEHFTYDQYIEHNLLSGQNTLLEETEPSNLY